MLSRGPAQHDDYVTVNCTSASSASECFPLCSVANCSAFIPPPPPPPQPGPIRDRHVPVRLLLTVSLLSAFLFLSLALATLLLLYRRRRLLRRRRLRATAPFPPNEGFGDDPEAGGGGVVHHVWYIRTVGLDEATIASIAVAEYRGGLGGGGDCAVCLGEFSDGDLVRLLPRCAHAFHVPCIDTWLRDHVNCPLCRSLVAAPSDPSAASSEAESEGAEPDAHQTLDETSQSDSQAEGSEFSSDTHSEEAATTAEDDARALPKPIRRSASMDSPLFLVVVPPVQDDAVEGNRKVRFFRGKEREGCGAAGSSSSGQVGRFGIGRSMSSSGQGFFFSRNGRSRSSVLPL